MEILVDGKLVVISKESDVKVREQNPLGLDYIDYPTEHKAHGLNEMRSGYFNICKDGELKHEPLFELGTYENGTFFPQAN